MAVIFKFNMAALQGWISGGSTSEIVWYVIVYICAKFGAFIAKCTLSRIYELRSCTNILHRIVNIGHVSAACIMIQQTLGHALPWSRCQHHIGKVTLTHAYAFNDLKIDVSRSPEVTLFTQFRKNFMALPHNTIDQTLSGFGASSVPEGHQFTETLRHDVLTVALSELDLQRVCGTVFALSWE